jgi:hypothetical protein
MRQGLQIDGAYGIGFGHNDPSALLDKARPLAVADAAGRPRFTPAQEARGSAG